MKTLSIISLAALLALPAWAAIPGTAVFEIRTTGSDTNGGGFDSAGSGTDMSQFANKNAVGCTSCQSSTANLSTTDAVANGTTTITSATAAFTSAITGNIINFSGGTGSIANQFRRATFVSATSITIDLAIASSTGMTMNIGGAWASLTPCNSFAQNGNTCFVQNVGAEGASVYTITATAVSSANFINVIGYTSTRSAFNTDARPKIQTGANSVTAVTSASVTINRIHFDGNTGGGFTTSKLAANGVFIDDYVENYNTASTGNNTFIHNFATGNTATALVCGICKDNTVTAQTAVGITVSTVLGVAAGNLVYANTGAGISLTGNGAVAWNNTVNGVTGDGFSAVGGAYNVVLNNYAQANSSHGFNVSNNGKVAINNGGEGNTTANFTGANGFINFGFITPSASAFASGTNNYALNNTASAGASLRAAAYWPTDSGGTTSNFLDVGAFQHQDPAGTGGVHTYPIGRLRWPGWTPIPNAIGNYPVIPIPPASGDYGNIPLMQVGGGK